MNTTNIKNVVKEKYGQAALRVKSGGIPVMEPPRRGLGCDRMLQPVRRRPGRWKSLREAIPPCWVRNQPHWRN
jgi:hypothetical protein